MTETAPDDAVTVPADDGRPHSPALAGFAAVTAALVGIAAIMLYGWTSEEGWHLLITLAMITAGALVARPAGDPDARRTWVLGRRVLTGIGAASVVLGAYLTGHTFVQMSIPDGPFFGSQRPELPPPVVLLLLLYGVPLIALIILAARGLEAGLVGTGLVVPVLAVSILVVAGAGASVVAIASLVVAIACVPVALVSKARWGGSLAILIGLMAASFAVGAGVSPFGTLATSTSRPAAKATEAAAGTLPTGLVPVVLVLALGAAAVLLVLAVSRRDVASALVGATLFAVPPAYLLIPTLMTGEGIHLSRSLALAAIPLAVLVITLFAWRASALREVLARVLRLPGTHPSGFAAAAGIAAVTLAVYSLPAFGLPGRVSGVITLAVLAAATVLAVRLPGLPGAVVAAVTLVALQLDAPWLRVVNGDRGFQNGFVDWQIGAIMGLIVAVAAAVVLVLRHRRAGVWAAAAYLLAGAIANVLWALLGVDRLSVGRDGDFEAITVLVLPLLMLGIPAAVAALRGSAAGQAVGAVLVAVGAFIPLNTLASKLPPGVDSTADVALQFTFAPFTPTNVQGVARLLDAGAWVLAGALLMLLLSLVLLASTARRASAPLTAAVTLGVLVAAQVTVVSLGREWGVDTTDGILGIFAAVAAVLAATTLLAVATRRSTTV